MAIIILLLITIIVIITILLLPYRAEIVVYQESTCGGNYCRVVESCAGECTVQRKILLCTTHPHHYDIVYSKQQETARAHCQGEGTKQQKTVWAHCRGEGIK